MRGGAERVLKIAYTSAENGTPIDPLDSFGEAIELNAESGRNQEEGFMNRIVAHLMETGYTSAIVESTLDKATATFDAAVDPGMPDPLDLDLPTVDDERIDIVSTFTPASGGRKRKGRKTRGRRRA